ncbi:MAG: bifunctional phosphoribosylaminoimidazolecarboxamide formyltransferase/IMP cyclohydrolase [Actinobacteria bacterium RBG_16_64_13]|nr:MAG: bifunctional phosphoribosylaminoimidazolecarboxamide formyltransferase/IMP cyclohydrolase [Actinobacteria bacterium RBG_16_64_13]
MKVKRALVSVSDKNDLEPFVRGLVKLGVEVISTGGTARFLREAGLPITGISEVTGFPEIMDGRVKTLHPAIHGGILADRAKPSHMKAIADLGIEPIDLVVVNLYPFEATVAQRGVSEADAVENIDIGGPSMVRSAAKNFSAVGIVTDPGDYDTVLAELKENGGELSRETRRHLAAKAFHHTAHYDSAIAGWFGEQEADFPEHLMLDLVKLKDLRYGENPHQRASWYSEVGADGSLTAALEQLHGQQLSFNNLLDLDSARRVLDEFALPACVIVKHNNPCGVAVAENAAIAYEKAVSCDPVSAFGGVIVVNRVVDQALARGLATNFVEVLWAPGYAEDAFDILTAKKDIRILTGQQNRDCYSGFDMKRVMGGMLVQDWDCEVDQRENMHVVSTRTPTEAEWGDLLFAWRVAKNTKSNAIILVKDLMTVGVGAGQMSRVDSANLAVNRARFPLAGCAVASDAFFPFPDALQVCIDAGATCVIHPGGSKRDDESLALAEAHGMAMVVTGRRHFKH